MKYLNPNKKICCDDVIQCVYNLNKLDLRTYKKLCETEQIRASELAKKLKKERSTVYRSLQRLLCSGLCNKNTKTLEKGGYYHTYTAIDKKEVKKNLEKCIDNWYKRMEKTLEDL